MSEKRVKIGAGLRLRRPPNHSNKDTVERISERGDLSASEPPIYPDETQNSEKKSDADSEMAEIFKAPPEQQAQPPSENIGWPSVQFKGADQKSADHLDVDFSELSANDQGRASPKSIPEVELLAPGAALDNEFSAIGGIERATGNYLLTLGYPGSGKTVLQSFLYFFIATNRDYANKMEKQREGAHPQFLSESLLNRWLADWSSGVFPEATRESVEAIREIRLKLVPKINPARTFNFSFVEVSGELIKNVVPTEVQAGTFVETMHNFLTAPKSNKIIVYVFDHKEGSNNDELFASLIRYLERTTTDNLDKLYSLLIVVPDPDFVLPYMRSDKRFKGRYNDNNAFTPEALRHYLRVRAPQLSTTFQNWKRSKRGLYKFHIGSVQIDPNGRQTLISPDFTDCRRIIEFCYKQFKGSRLKASWLSRIKRALRA